jgi:PKD repeat protein
MVQHSGIVAMAVFGFVIVTVGFVSPVMAIGTYSDGYNYYNFEIYGYVYEHNPVTLQDIPKEGVIVRLYGTDNTAGLHTNNLEGDVKTDSKGHYKFSVPFSVPENSWNSADVRAEHKYYQVTCYEDSGSEYEIYDIQGTDIGDLCGNIGETFGTSLKWVTIEKGHFVNYLFPCPVSFYVHKKGQPFTVQTPAGISMQTMDRTDLRGNDYRVELLTRSVPKDCSDWCILEKNCKAATYVNPGVQGTEARCWLKNTVPASSENSNTISFVKVDAGNVPPGGGSWCTGGVIPGFSATSLEGPVPLTVSFTDTSEGDVAIWQWDFNNDGSFESTLKDPTYTFTIPGVYPVTLQVNSSTCATKITATKDAYITATEATGSLEVNSDPDAASLFIDGSYRGSTPFKASSIAPGTHTVLITKNGYVDYTQSVTVRAGQNLVFSAVLSPNQITTVTTTPAPFETVTTTPTPFETVTTTPTPFVDITTRPTGVIVPGFIWIGAIAALATGSILIHKRKM